MAQARNWCWTLNNPTPEQSLSILSLECQYVIFGKETGASGTPHLQGYIQFYKRLRFNAVKRLLPGCHIEVARASAQANIDYCSKDGNVEFRGNPKHKGERADLDIVRRDAAENGMQNVCRWANLQQIRVAEKFLTYCEEPRNWKPNVTWLWGGPGTGKTRRAHEMLANPYVKNTGSKWFDGYDGHDEILLDDFRDTWWELGFMLGLLDRYAFRVEHKGGSRQFVCKEIVVTSPFPPNLMYRNQGEDIDQLLRRIDTIVELKK